MRPRTTKTVARCTESVGPQRCIFPSGHPGEHRTMSTPPRDGEPRHGLVLCHSRDFVLIDARHGGDK